MKIETIQEYKDFLSNKGIKSINVKHYNDYKGTGRKISFISGNSGIEYVFKFGYDLFEIVIPNDSLSNKEVIFDELANF